MASKIQLQIAPQSGGGQIPIDQVGGAATGVKSLNALTGDLLLVSGDGSITVETPIPSVVNITAPGIAIAQAAANSKVASVVPGTRISVDNTDPTNPVVSATGAAGVTTIAGLAGVVGVVSPLNTLSVGVTGQNITLDTPAVGIANAALAVAAPLNEYQGDLPDADATIFPNVTPRNVVRADVYTGDHNVTLSPAGVANRQEVIIMTMSSNGASRMMTVVNGGIGGGNLLTFDVTTAWKAIFLFDGINWILDRQSRLVSSVNP